MSSFGFKLLEVRSENKITWHIISLLKTCGFVAARASSVSSAAENGEGKNFGMIVNHTQFRERRKTNCKAQS
jgi:cytochrome c biogenesis protein ResB